MGNKLSATTEAFILPIIVESQRHEIGPSRGTGNESVVETGAQVVTRHRYELMDSGLDDTVSI